MLAAEFGDLESYLGWALEGDDVRTRRRLEASVDEVTGFYQAMLPRFPAAMTYLGTVDPRALSEADRALLCLTVAFVEVADTVEYYAPAGSSGPADLLRFTSSHDLLGLAVGRSAGA